MAGSGIGDNFAAIALAPPRLERLAPLADAFRLRRTEHRFASRMLEPQLLSDLLWAACGRQAGADFLAASASQGQEIDIFVALEQGLYLYEPERARLAPVLSGDWRPLAVAEGLARTGDAAPVRLVYVADVERLAHTDSRRGPPIQDPETQKAYSLVDCGIVAAHVFLFAAASGLAAWFHECDRAALAKRLPLRAGRRVLFAQTVGYPA
jgi:hypothetical protein